MTADTQIIPIQQQQRSQGFTLSPEQSALAIEIGKCLKLVAPATMNAEAQLSWIASAVDALDGIRAAEVQHISAELRRTVTRPAQIVPEIARMVSERRARMSQAANADPTATRERAIDEEAMKRRCDAKSQEEVDAAAEWERRARMDASLAVPPRQAPLTRAELDDMSNDMRSLGLKNGFFEMRNGQLFEIAQ